MNRGIRLNYYRFKPRNYPIITSWLLKYIVEAFTRGLRCFRVTLDLGITYTNICIESLDDVALGDLRINVGDALNIVKDDTVYVLSGNDLIPIKFYDEVLRRFYKLRALGIDIAPTLEINGIHMHRIEGIDPWSDAVIKVRSLGRIVGGKVLDIGTGLGYTAINSLRKGAREVLSIEVDENVLRIASLNPWSKELEHVKIVLGDASKVLTYLSDNEFTHVIHDPPRYELAGELYSLEFYKELYRVLRSGGKLFHYVGKPKQRRARILKGVKERLLRAGFVNVIWVEEALGFRAVKP